MKWLKDENRRKFHNPIRMVKAVPFAVIRLALDDRRNEGGNKAGSI
jgi:hypothetical protein